MGGPSLLRGSLLTLVLLTLVLPLGAVGLRHGPLTAESGGLCFTPSLSVVGRGVVGGSACNRERRHHKADVHRRCRVGAVPMTSGVSVGQENQSRNITDAKAMWNSTILRKNLQGSTSKPVEDWDFDNLEFQTPLWMITQEPDLNNLVKYLQTLKDLILESPDSRHHVTFSRAQIEAARTAFSRMVRRGEMRLHRLCELTGDDIFDKSYARQSVVIGQRPGSKGQGQRFQLVQPLSGDELYALTDLDLGSRQLERFKWQQSNSWERAALVANFVEYEALEVNEWGVFKCISRIKAEEEIWNKVVDEIFDIDNLVKREKELRHLSRFVKDVFGLKLVVGDEEQARRVQKHLQEMVFSDESLMAHGVPVLDSTRKVSVIEVKDYLTETSSQTKTSGWRALKSVVMWWDTPIEIQLQVLRNYHRERERITKESHSEFKARREELRDLIASGIPLFGFYRDLLQWLFGTTAADVEAPPPVFKNVIVEMVD